jgi:hypothetical protein
MSWDRKFDEPIPLPKGKPLVTLRDTALYITKLTKAEHDAKEWQAAMEALILMAERGGPTMFARIGVMRALNRHVERVFTLDSSNIVIADPRASRYERSDLTGQSNKIGHIYEQSRGCVYRKLKLGRSGGAVRQGWRVI